MKLRVGAGQAVIRYTDEMLPNVGENYTCIHDDSYVQVLYIEYGNPVAIVAVGSVGTAEPDVVRGKVAEVLGLDVVQVAVFAKHVLSAPHANRRDTPEQLKEREGRRGRVMSDEQAELYVKRSAMMCDAQLNAAIEAAHGAKANIQDAVMRFAVGFTDVVCNRLVHTNKGWWQGHNPDIPADGSVPVLRFDDEAGKPIAILFGVNSAPGVLENSFLADGGRAISGDLAAYTERKLEAQYGEGTIAIYGIGSTGDQWQSLRALQDEIDINGNQTITDLHEGGYILLEIMASRLAEAVIKAAEKAEVQELPDELKTDHFRFSYTAQKIRSEGHRPPQPATSIEYVEDGEAPIGLIVISLGDTAIIMVGAELGSRTWRKIKENSPFKNMMILEFTGNLGGGYLLEKDFYDMITYQSQKTRYFAGSAEKYCDDIIAALNKVKNS